MNEMVRSAKYYDRWRFTVRLEEWLIKARNRREITIEDFYKEIAKITGERAINNIVYNKGSRCYIAYSAEKRSYEFVLEKAKNTAGIVFFYDDHREVYDPMFRLGYEVYFYENNGKAEEIFFHHSESEKREESISCQSYTGISAITFVVRNNEPFYKIVSDHKKVFKTFFEFKVSEREHYEGAIQKSFEVFKKTCEYINSNVVSFRVRLHGTEYLEYSNGKVSRMRAKVNGNFVVICDSDVWWEESLDHHEEFRCIDGVVFNGKEEVVDDIELSNRIKTCITKAQEMYNKFQEDLATQIEEK